MDRWKLKIKAIIANIGKPRMILGIPWLRKYNPHIDWKKGTISWINPKLKEEFQELQQLQNIKEFNSQIYKLNTKISTSQKLEMKGKQKEKKPPEEIVPQEYHDYLSLFNEKKSKRYPPARIWDHKIETKNKFEPKAFKPYKLSFAEIEEQKKFIKENLQKGYIKPSKSPMASPFLFVAKKDGKLQPCQDYRYLNNNTIKNAYPIPNIQSILDKLRESKYFTALDV